MLDRKDFVTCGWVVKTHGSSGQVKVSFSEHFEPEYRKGDWLFLGIEEKPVPFFIEFIEYPGDGLPVFSLEDVDNPEVALKLVKKPVLLPTDELSDWQESPLVLLSLVGYNVWDTQQQFKGIIEAIEEQADQFLLTLRQENNESLMVPCHPTLIAGIDHEAKSLTLHFPEGLEGLE